jgi:hypothetical protein
MPRALSAVLRCGLALITVALGGAFLVITSLWWGGIEQGSFWWGLRFCLAFIVGILPLGLLYAWRGPSVINKVLPVLGGLAMSVAYIAGATTAHDIVMSKVGVDAEATVDSQTRYHCSVRHLDGTLISQELRTDCEGFKPGDTLSVVHDPHDRFAPIPGHKSGLEVEGGVWITGAAGLVVLAVIAIGSPPVRPRNKTTNVHDS